MLTNKELRFFIVLLLILFFPFSILHSETLILKNGDYYNGKSLILEQDIQIDTYEGKRIRFPKRLVLKLVYRELSEKQIEVIKKQEEKVIQEEKDKIAKENQIKLEKIKAIEKLIAAQQASQEQIVKLQEEIELLKSQIVSIEEDFIITDWGQIWRSAVLPGWGMQFVSFASKNKNYKILGYTYSSIYFIALSGLAYHRLNYQEKYDSYKHISNNTLMQNIIATQGKVDPLYLMGLSIPSRKKYNQYTEAAQTYNNVALFLGSFYLFQILHSWYEGKKYNQSIIQESDIPIEDSSWNIIPSIYTSSLPNGTKEACYEIRYNKVF